MDVNIVTQMVRDREGKNKRDGGVVEEIGRTDAEKKNMFNLHLS